MYRELSAFLKHILRDRSLFKDGEFTTAVALGVALGLWTHFDPRIIASIRRHFTEILTITSIVFGFVFTTLVFYIQATEQWSKEKNVRTVATRLVDWHVYTTICLLVLIGYVVVLWAFSKTFAGSIPYAFLGFLVTYCAGQILNHALTVWWVFKRRNLLSASTDDDSVRLFDSSRRAPPR